MPFLGAQVEKSSSQLPSLSRTVVFLILRFRDEVGVRLRISEDVLRLSMTIIIIFDRERRLTRPKKTFQLSSIWEKRPTHFVGTFFLSSSRGCWCCRRPQRRGRLSDEIKRWVVVAGTLRRRRRVRRRVGGGLLRRRHLFAKFCEENNGGKIDFERE